MTGSRLRIACSIVIGLAAIVGTIVDPAPERPPVTRAGWRVLEVDLHSHTRFADGFLSPFDLVLHARRHGLDALAITDHNMLFPALMGRWFASKIGGPTILVGEEITARDYHVHGVGLTRLVDASLPLSKVIDEVHAQGGIIIAAHPVKRFWPLLVPLRPRFDAAEVMHPIAFGARGSAEGGTRKNSTNEARFVRSAAGDARDGGWRWEEMRDYYEDALASGQRITAVASSDYHFFSPLGVTRTLVFARTDAEADVLDALHAGRTVVLDLAGRAYGDPALIDALAAEPYTMRPQDYGYRGSGPVDRIFRVVGFAALVGLLLFGRRRERA